MRKCDEEARLENIRADTSSWSGADVSRRDLPRVLAARRWADIRIGSDYLDRGPIHAAGFRRLPVTGDPPLGLEARRHIGPFSLGLVACVLIWSGRLVFDAAAITFGGIGILAGAYGWAYFLRGKNGAASCCSTCEVPELTAAGSTLTAEESVRTGVPIACALDKNQFAERNALLDRLAQAAAERKSIPNGCGFRFGSERGLVSQLASFIELERACCPFLSFRIDVKAGVPSGWNSLGR